MWRESVSFAREIHAMLAAARLLTALLHLLARGLLGPYWKQQLATVTTSPSAVPRACETRQWQLWFRHHRLLHGIYVSTPRRSEWSGVEWSGVT